MFSMETEIYVLSTELAVGCCKSYLSSVADDTTFRKRLGTHCILTEKIDDETDD